MAFRESMKKEDMKDMKSIFDVPRFLAASTLLALLGPAGMAGCQTAGSHYTATDTAAEDADHAALSGLGKTAALPLDEVIVRAGRHLEALIKAESMLAVLNFTSPSDEFSVYVKTSLSASL